MDSNSRHPQIPLLVSLIKTNRLRLQMQERAYIAGPMRGYKWFNHPAFDSAKEEVERMGFIPVSPADIDRSFGFDPFSLGEDYDWNDIKSCGIDLSEVIDRDLEVLKSCSVIYMLRGWESSKGSVAEKAVAEWRGLVILYQDDCK